MRVAITGVQGFIGRWLREGLLAKGYEVVGADKRLGRRGLNLIKGTSARDWLAMYRPDVCVHLAAQVGRVLSDDDVNRTINSNVMLTVKVAQACADVGVPLVYASSSEVYGNHADALVTEDTPWNSPENLYGATKGFGETLCRLYHGDTSIVRLSMPYGSGAPPGRGRRAMDTFLWQAHHRMDITVHKGAVRSWCWVQDTCEGIRLAIHNPGVYNIGRDDDPRSMLEIAQKACYITAAPESLIQEVDPPPHQIVVKNLDTSRIRALGWSPTVELDEGMMRVYQWVRRYDRDGRYDPSC